MRVAEQRDAGGAHLGGEMRGFLDIRDRLVGQAIHEVHIDRTDPCFMQSGDALAEEDFRLNAAHGLLHGGGERLDAEADAIGAGGRHGVDEIRGQATRVYLDRDLGAGTQAKGAACMRDKVLEVFG